MARTKRQKIEAARRRAASAAGEKRGPAPGAKPNTATRPPVQAPERAKAVRPTEQRLSKGAFRMPTGPLRQDLPAVDEAHDCVAALLRARLITPEQEAAARDWQELKAAVRAELGLSQGRSCLDLSPAGHDDSDGDSEVMRRWREVEARLGLVKVGALDWTVVYGRKPGNLPLLREALDAFWE